jgi:hypothetical protein
MWGKEILLYIPNDENLPEEIKNYSPEKTLMLLKLGNDCLKLAEKKFAEFSQKEIYKKVEEENKEELEKLKYELLLQKDREKIGIEKVVQIYESQLVALRRQMDLQKEQLKDMEGESKIKIQEEIMKVREKYDLLLSEKEKQVDKMNENYEKLIFNSNKTNKEKGEDGEKTFSDYASTFKDFNNYEIVDMHTQGGQGDFHMHFENFDILVDAKNYKTKVSNSQREKIKRDLLKNEHIHFAWLVSLNTTIDKYDRAPIMYEWINSKQAIVYINNLLEYEDPCKILRIVWFNCKELYKLTEEANTDYTELSNLKDKQFKMNDKIKNLRKNIRELNTNMNTHKNIIQCMDDNLREMLEIETNELAESSFSLFENYWSENIESKDKKILISTDIWNKFKIQNKDLVKEFSLTSEKFKKFLKTKLCFDSLREVSKGGAYEIQNVYWKSSLEEKKGVESLIDVELKAEVVTKKKIVKTSKINN